MQYDPLVEQNRLKTLYQEQEQNKSDFILVVNKKKTKTLEVKL